MRDQGSRERSDSHRKCTNRLFSKLRLSEPDRLLVKTGNRRNPKGDGGQGMGQKMSREFTTCHDKLQQHITLCSCDWMRTIWPMPSDNMQGKMAGSSSGHGPSNHSFCGARCGGCPGIALLAPLTLPSTNLTPLAWSPPCRRGLTEGGCEVNGASGLALCNNNPLARPEFE